MSTSSQRKRPGSLIQTVLHAAFRLKDPTVATDGRGRPQPIDRAGYNSRSGLQMSPAGGGWRVTRKTPQE